MMRPIDGATPVPSALLRRAAAWLAIATLLAVSSGQPFHPGAAASARQAFGVAAASACVDAASPPHQGAHLPGLCSQCRAIGQARMGLRPPAVAAAGCVDAVGLPAAHARVDSPHRAPWLAVCAPRAPPLSLPTLDA